MDTLKSCNITDKGGLFSDKIVNDDWWETNRIELRETPEDLFFWPLESQVRPFEYVVARFLLGASIWKYDEKDRARLMDSEIPFLVV